MSAAAKVRALVQSATAPSPPTPPPPEQRDRSTYDDNGGPLAEPVAPDPWQAELAAALAEIRQALGTADATTRVPIFEDADIVDLLRREFTRPPWLVTGLVTRGGVTVIGAEPKAAKTWLGTELAIGVATGSKVCGEFSAALGRVAYFYAEDLDHQVRNRVRALVAGRGGEVPERGRLYVRPRAMFLDITKVDDLAWIVASCRRLGQLDLLVLDPLRDIHSAAEDKSDEMSPVMRSLRLVATLLGCTVAVVHHAGKSSKDTDARRPGQKLRGSGAIHGAIDSGIYLENSTGDGVSVIRNVVRSEVKGARSAGKFSLAVTIEDDEQGEAIRATWLVTRGTPTLVSVPNGEPGLVTDMEAVVRHVRELADKRKHLTKSGLRDYVAKDVPRRRFDPAFVGLETSDRVCQRKEVDAKGQEKGYKLVFLVAPPAEPEPEPELW